MFKFQGGFEPVRILTFPMCTVLTIQYNMDLGAFTNVHSRLPSAVVKRICEDLRSGRQFVTSPSDRNQPSGKLPNIRRGRPWYPSMNSIAARSEKWRGLVRLSAKSSPDRNVCQVFTNWKQTAHSRSKWACKLKDTKSKPLSHDLYFPKTHRKLLARHTHRRPDCVGSQPAVTKVTGLRHLKGVKSWFQ